MRGHEAGRRPQVGRVLVQANTLGPGRCRFCAGDRHTPSQVHMGCRAGVLVKHQCADRWGQCLASAEL